MIDTSEREKYENEINNMEPKEIIKWAINKFGLENIGFATSLGAEDQVLTDIISRINPDFNIFTLDTGRLPEETYNTIVSTMSRYNVKIEILFPDKEQVEKMLNEYGPNLFYRSVDLRKKCCEVRKIEPLKRKLKTLKAWITGIRREQSVTRKEINKVEWDKAFGLYKVNPLIDWPTEKVWSYIREHNVPYNLLHDRNYPSIGCAPCTRGVKEGEDIRAGRWWWENPENKECGLHRK